IAGVLSSLDDKIDLLNRENATLEALAETLFRHYFIENPDPTWKEGKLGDVVDVKSGFAFKGSSFVEGGKYKLVTIKAVQDGFLSLENSDCITEVPSNVKDYCYLKKGDILLSLTGNVGRCCLVDSDGLLLNQRVALLVAKDKRNWSFVYTFFRLQSTKSLLEEMAKGTAQPNLSPVELAKMSFLIPPQNIFEQFGREASPIIGKVLSNRQQMQILSTLRDTLLPRLMSGVVKVSWQ
ncbi:MAG: restriction endonuclease subunit S, partial [Bacteroidales bacterium]|nr:restriction endonuclease subunit S [Bacteroidales bacterium]